MRPITCYGDFVETLLEAGFSLGGGSAKGIYSAIPFSWEAQETLRPASPLRWHTEDPETDPWEWRMRVLAERRDIAYAKCFFGLGGFITRAWYPRFLAVRRGGSGFAEAYAEGRFAYDAKRIYAAAQEAGPCLLPDLKRLAGFGSGENAAFERALTALQMGLYLTICGQRRRRNLYGMEYGWHCTILCTTEAFWPEAVFAEAEALDPEQAEEELRAQILRLNPAAKEAAIRRFLRG